MIDVVLEKVKTGELIVGDVGRGVAQGSNIKQQIETPYLQLVMSRLWSEELGQNSRVLHLNTLHRLGGAQRIVSKHHNRVMKKFRITDRAAAAAFFQYLVTPSGSKIAYPVSDLITISRRSAAEVEGILKELENERVLRYIPPPIHQPGFVRYEIYHDVLARSILDWQSRFLRLQKAAMLMTDIAAYLLWFFSAGLLFGISDELLSLIIALLSTSFFLVYVFYMRKRLKIFTGI